MMGIKELAGVFIELFDKNHKTYDGCQIAQDWTHLFAMIVVAISLGSVVVREAVNILWIPLHLFFGGILFTVLLGVLVIIRDKNDEYIIDRFSITYLALGVLLGVLGGALMLASVYGGEDKWKSETDITKAMVLALGFLFIAVGGYMIDSTNPSRSGYFVERCNYGLDKIEE